MVGAYATAAVHAAPEAHKQRVREGPGLALVEAQVAHAQPHLFHDLAAHGVLDRLANLGEAGDECPQLEGAPLVAREDNPLAIRYGSDDARLDLGIDNLCAVGAHNLPAVRSELHLVSAARAVAVVPVPRGKLRAHGSGKREVGGPHATQPANALVGKARWRGDVLVECQEEVLLANAKRKHHALGLRGIVREPREVDCLARRELVGATLAGGDHAHEGRAVAVMQHVALGLRILGFKVVVVRLARLLDHVCSSPMRQRDSPFVSCVHYPHAVRRMPVAHQHIRTIATRSVWISSSRRHRRNPWQTTSSSPSPAPTSTRRPRAATALWWSPCT